MAGGEDVGDSSSKTTIQHVNMYTTKIYVAKFEGIIIFGTWMCEMRDSLNVQNFGETLDFEECLQQIDETVWKKMNQFAYDVICSCLTHDIKYPVINGILAKKLLDMLDNKFLTKIVESCLHLKRRLYAIRLRMFSLVNT